MKARAFLLVLVWVVSIGPAAAMERHAFLNKPATTTEQLVRQVKNDRVVACRYMRHFAMTQHDLAVYFRTLSPAILPYTGDFAVYHVLPNGKIEVRTLHLKRGTMMFSEPGGKVVLKRSCGNPMTLITSNQPFPVTQADVKAPEATIQSFAALAVPPSEPAVAPVPAFVDDVPPTVVALLPGLPDLTFGDLPETQKKAVGPAVPVGPGFPFPLFLVPFLFPPNHGHPVPEPSGIAAGLVGLGALTLTMRAGKLIR